MKIQLSLAAKDLAKPGLYHAVVTDKDHSYKYVGETETHPQETTDPVWNQLVIVDNSDDTNIVKTVEVAVYNSDNAMVATAAFALDEILAAPNHAIAKLTAEQDDAAAIISIHATQQQEAGRFRVTLGAKGLPNTDFGIGFRKQKTDPFFELYSSTGQKLLRSNLCEDTLNPVWEPVELDLDVLCGNDLYAPLRIKVYDQDKGDATEFLGGVEMSVHQMLQKESTLFVYSKGRIVVHEAELVSQKAASREAKTALDAVATALKTTVENLEKLRTEAAEKATSSELAAEKAKAARTLADAKQAEATAAANIKMQAENALSSLMQTSEQISKASQTMDCTGQLQIHLRAEALLNTDLGIFRNNKSDPMFELFKNDAKTPVHCSNKVEDNLNPVWDVQTVDLTALCDGKLDTPVKILVYDKDKGDTQRDLGFAVKTVSELLKMSPTEGIVLQGQPGEATTGTLYVTKAELVNYEDLKVEAEKAVAAVEEAKKHFMEAKQTWHGLAAQADEASREAATATEEAQQAKDQADAAALAVQMAEAKLD